jgi:predicted nucleic acid-binding protein
MDTVLIDTNLLVYMYDRSEPDRQRQAIDLLRRVYRAQSGTVSAQVLSEFYNTTTRKLSPPLTSMQARAQLDRLARVWPVFPVTSHVVFEAIRGMDVYQFSFWDAQIWAVARLNQVPVILSEDFNPGAAIEGVHFVNPFAPDFDPAALGL